MKVWIVIQFYILVVQLNISVHNTFNVHLIQLTDVLYTQSLTPHHHDADSLIDQLAAIGARHAIAGRLAQWDQRADIVAVCVGPDAPEAVLAAVETAAPPTRLTA